MDIHRVHARSHICIKYAAGLSVLVLTAPSACANDSAPLLEEAAAPPNVPNTPVPPPESDGGAKDAAVDSDASPACSESGFCYTPLPERAPLVAVSARSIDDAWAAGDNVVMRWDGASWSEVYRHETPVESQFAFFNIAAAPDSVWATAMFANLDSGDDLPDDRSTFFFARYSNGDGGTPVVRETQVDRPFDLDVAIFDRSVYFKVPWVTPEGDSLWLAEGRTVAPDENNRVIRFDESPDGTITMQNATPTAGVGDTSTYAWHSVWGFARDDVYVGGRSCTALPCDPLEARSAIAHYDGSTWSMTTLDTTEPVRGIFGATGNDQSRQLWLWLGLPRAPGGVYVGGSIRLVPISNDGSIGAPLYVKDLPAANYGKLKSCSNYYTIFGAATSPTAAWVTNGCSLSRWDGHELREARMSLGELAPGAVNGLWAGGDDDAWIVGRSSNAQTPFPVAGFAAQFNGGQQP